MVGGGKKMNSERIACTLNPAGTDDNNPRSEPFIFSILILSPLLGHVDKKNTLEYLDTNQSRWTTNWLEMNQFRQIIQI